MDMTLWDAALASIAAGSVILVWAHADTWGGIIDMPLSLLVLYMLLGT